MHIKTETRETMIKWKVFLFCFVEYAYAREHVGLSWFIYKKTFLTNILAVDHVASSMYCSKRVLNQHEN